MTDHSVPRTTFGLASEMETEANTLEACIGLINQTLQFSYKDAEQVGRAQSQLFVLTGALESLQGRLTALTAEAYDLARAEKAAA